MAAANEAAWKLQKRGGSMYCYCWLWVVMLLTTLGGADAAETRSRRVAAKVMPDPVTEADCQLCENSVAEQTTGVEKCKALITMMREDTDSVVAGHQATLRQAEQDQAVQEHLTDEKRSSLGSLRGRLLPAAWEKRQAAMRAAVATGVSLEAIGQHGNKAADTDPAYPEYDLAKRWLKCDAELAEAKTRLEACAARIEAEKGRLARREAQHEAAATSAQATAASIEGERNILTKAIGQTAGEAYRARTHTYAMEPAR